MAIEHFEEQIVPERKMKFFYTFRKGDHLFDEDNDDVDPFLPIYSTISSYSSSMVPLPLPRTKLMAHQNRLIINSLRIQIFELQTRVFFSLFQNCDSHIFIF